MKTFRYLRHLAPRTAIISAIACLGASSVWAQDLPGAFEATGFDVSTDGDQPWVMDTVTTHDGEDSAKAGAIDDEESSGLEVIVQGPGDATFWWKVSSEQDFDFLIFYVDGVEDERISGLTEWEAKLIELGAGEHTLRWEYTKDDSVFAREDTGWVDQFFFGQVDSDVDGLRDEWEIAHFGNLSQDGDGDFDGDGQSNAAEEASGTDPADATSLLITTMIEPMAGDSFRIEWQSVQGKTYTVQGSGDLVTWTDIRSGIPSGGAITSTTVSPGGAGALTTLVSSTAQAHAHVPTNATLGTIWRGGDESAFTAAGGTAGWIVGPLGVGYEAGSGYDQYFGIDVLTLMQNRNTSVYIRAPFTIPAPQGVASLTLNMRYDDGFVAYINGVQVAGANFNGSPIWNSEATTTHDDGAAVGFIAFDIGDVGIPALVPGNNVLAIHGLNRGTGSSDLLIQPELTSLQSLEQYHWRVMVE